MKGWRVMLGTTGAWVAARMLAAWAAEPAPETLSLPGIFSDHMVLQQDVPLTVWGTAPAGHPVTVSFREQTVHATADAQGRWRVRLAPLLAPRNQTGTELIVKADRTIVLRDVLVGEVWLGAGQSNMVWPVSQCRDGEKALRAAERFAIRLSSDTRWPSYTTLRTGWVRCSPATATSFSALLYYFGVRLQEELDVPVGLICRAVSGSPALPWVSRESFASNEACAAACRRAPTNGAASVAVPNAVGEWHAQFIAPIAGYAIRGVLWDQGESGTGVGGVEMRTALGLLVASWRQAWQCGAFPFFYVQKPSGGGCAWRAASAGSNAEPLPRLGLPPAPIPDGAADQGGRARQSFQDLETVQPNMAMCIASDLDAGLHPFGKDEYGRRLAAIALNRVYGVGIAYDGPRYVSHRVESDRVRVRFRNVGAGLVARHSEELLGFAVAGADRVFHWAEARIEGADVLVRSAAVSEPVAVRYAWAASPSWANLFNAEGLPALAFRTDDWPAAPGR